MVWFNGKKVSLIRKFAHTFVLLIHIIYSGVKKMFTAPLDYDEPVEISPLVTRVLADNSSVMTGPGTNSYLIGHDEIAVIDPGPGDRYHINAIIKAAGSKEKIKWIFITHSHPDHSPGAKMLQSETGAELFGLFPQLRHEQIIETSEFNLKVIHTPGHASDHLCYLLENENLLFSGDHVMQGSTVVIIPPSGHMRSYLDSLEKLKSYPIDRIAPGHGHVIETPIAEIDEIIEHRLEREAKVLSALKDAGNASVGHLLSDVYDDVPYFMHSIAAYSLEAHLIKLEEDGVVGSDGNSWYCI